MGSEGSRARRGFCVLMTRLMTAVWREEGRIVLGFAFKEGGWSR